MLTYALEDHFTILQASNGLEAVQVAERDHPDLILMDMDMPVMDGVEATRLIKTNPDLKDIKVLAVSGVESSERSRLILDMCDAFIEKSHDPDDLVKQIRALAEGGT